MNYEDIILRLKEAKIYDPDWFHWFGWHFQVQHPLAEDIIKTLTLLDARSPGCSKRLALKLGELGGKEKFEPHYEQLIQMLCELVIAKRLCEKFTAEQDCELIWEPTGDSKKNPEFMLRTPNFDLLVEVKCPSLLAHLRKANESNLQILARLGDMAVFEQLSDNGAATRPVDNRIKDFLESAESKFSTFKTEGKLQCSLLVICWDSKMFEAISPLINEMSGLLTERSFKTDTECRPVKFPNIDGILVTPHAASLMAFTRDEAILGKFSSPLDYGEFGYGIPAPQPVFISNPHSERTVPEEVIDALFGIPPDLVGDPMTAPLDLVFWLPLRKRIS